MRPVLVTILLILMGIPAQAGAVLDRIRAKGELVAAVSDGFPPVAFIGQDGQLTGFDVEVGRELARRLGVRYRTVTPSWEATVAGRWGGRWDIAVGSMTPTPERARVLSFPALYYQSPAALAVHEKNSSINGLPDLSGRRVGVCQACTSQDYFEGRGSLTRADGQPATPPAGVKVVAYEGEGTALDDLRLGDGVRLDAVLASLPTLLAAKAKGLPIKILPDRPFTERLAIATDKGDPAWEAEILRQIKEMRADGTLARLSQTWFGTDLTVSPEAVR